MCWKQKPNPITPAKKRALLFAINNYPGSQNDLNGCINDQVDLSAMLTKNFPDFDIRKFKDFQVTASNFKSELENAIKVMAKGDILLCHYSGHGTQVPDTNGDESDNYDEAIYLFDTYVTDDEIRNIILEIPSGAIVVFAFDSCFSGTITRDICNHKAKFMRLEGTPLLTTPNRKIRSTDSNYIVFSGSSEWQTSADAFIGGRYNGAFTYFWLKAFKRGFTYQQWFDNLKTYLPSKEYDQIPTLDGDRSLYNRKIFE